LPAARSAHQRHRELLESGQRHLRKYNGIPRQNFDLFLKECEWRFNHGPPKRLLETLLRWSSLKPALKR
jgi:transposase-like protein